MHKPIGVSVYQLKDILPEALQGNLPTIEQLEAELKPINKIELDSLKMQKFRQK